MWEGTDWRERDIVATPENFAQRPQVLEVAIERVEPKPRTSRRELYHYLVVWIREKQ